MESSSQYPYHVWASDMDEESSACIRVACPERDAAAIAAIYGPYVQETAISFEEIAPTPSAIADRIRHILTRYPYLVFEADGEVLGFAYGCEHKLRSAYRWSADVSVYVKRGRHRGGVGRALYKKLLVLLQDQGLHLAFAGITLPNAGSVGLHEAMGFSHIGTYCEVGYKLGSWRDVGWWRLSLSEADTPREPVTFAEIAELHRLRVPTETG